MGALMEKEYIISLGELIVMASSEEEAMQLAQEKIAKGEDIIVDTIEEI